MGAGIFSYSRQPGAGVGARRFVPFGVLAKTLNERQLYLVEERQAPCWSRRSRCDSRPSVRLRAKSAPVRKACWHAFFPLSGLKPGYLLDVPPEPGGGVQ